MIKKLQKKSIKTRKQIILYLVIIITCVLIFPLWLLSFQQVAKSSNNLEQNKQEENTKKERYVQNINDIRNEFTKGLEQLQGIFNKTTKNKLNAPKLPKKLKKTTPLTTDKIEL